LNKQGIVNFQNLPPSLLLIEHAFIDITGGLRLVYSNMDGAGHCLPQFFIYGEQSTGQMA
ncbi:MAG: hypothetical protein RLO81_13675, partial [Fulvivirga sp.]|uniref:hypothetical protein n=1 Tax=Fulvivirga sp. TaxID=1931237 RepID=UPI0032EB3D4F